MPTYEHELILPREMEEYRGYAEKKDNLNISHKYLSIYHIYRFGISNVNLNISCKNDSYSGTKYNFQNNMITDLISGVKNTVRIDISPSFSVTVSVMGFEQEISYFIYTTKTTIVINNKEI